MWRYPSSTLQPARQPSALFNPRPLQARVASGFTGHISPFYFIFLCCARRGDASGGGGEMLAYLAQGGGGRRIQRMKPIRGRLPQFLASFFLGSSVLGPPVLKPIFAGGQTQDHRASNKIFISRFFLCPKSVSSGFFGIWFFYQCFFFLGARHTDIPIIIVITNQQDRFSFLARHGLFFAHP